jgi:hypothetical protein
MGELKTGTLADHQQSAICYQRALGLFRGLGDRYNEAGTLTCLGDVHLSAGDSGAACRAWPGFRWEVSLARTRLASA